MAREFPQTDAEEAEKKRRQEEAQREHEIHERHRLEGRRKICTFLHFPFYCADRRCKRARVCAGDVEACFELFWPVVPEGIKNKIRQTIKFMSEGMTPHEAVEAAAEFVAQRQRIDEATAAREAAEREAPPEPAPAPVKITRTHAPVRHAGPRIRGM